MTSTATVQPMSAPAKPVVCSDAAEATEKLTSSLWKPLAMCAMYVCFLRNWYVAFKAKEAGSSAFGDVWLSAPIVATVLYLGLIFGIKKYMADRKPMNLKDYMFSYNLYQTILNLWCVCAFIKEVYTQNMSIWGNQVDDSPNGFRLGFLVWVHYNNKYIELLDTVFMALRKKNNQISFLHMYHHVLLIWSWYLVCKFGCGGDAYFGALCNSLIHVLMYGYYLLALLKINTPWKKYLTSCQMFQFVLCFSHAVYVLFADNYPAWLAGVEIWVMSNMLVLFGNFYRKTYSTKPKKMAEEKKTA